MEKFTDWHLYLGCKTQCHIEDCEGNFTIERTGTLTYSYEEDDFLVMVDCLPGDDFDFDLTQIQWKPILRRVRSMTDVEQQQEYQLTRFAESDVDTSGRQGMARSFRYLLSIGFDLFGLIDSGQAIDAATLTTK